MPAGEEFNRDEALMRRAFREARRAVGRASPNPLVGCVVAEEGSIRATGFHDGPGEPHAEIAALESLEGSAEGADVYVNLEPCCHHGRTPPCVDALLEADVGRVFVAMEDPDPRVDGDGIRRLREAGVDVDVGLLEDEARRLNRAYLRYMTAGRPWVTVKYAMTLDGKIATRTGESAWITGEDARRRVHELRDRSDAIMVGTGTLKSDDPRLTCRIPEGRDPMRVVLDARLEGSLDSNVYSGGDTPETLAVVEAGRPLETAEKVEALESRGVELVEIETGPEGELDLERLLGRLAERGVVRLFVEGGGRVVGSLFDGQLIDRVHVFIAPKLVGGARAPGPNEGDGVDRVHRSAKIVDRETESFGDDLLISGTVEYQEYEHSPADASGREEG
jgi:diaminohydroxyphosphoribosylaminopyrimidine deaminase/5-amino-6-(5-phosphoribosylamino)uracil reductase